jgi:hypothetical protein
MPDIYVSEEHEKNKVAKGGKKTGTGISRQALKGEKTASSALAAFMPFPKRISVEIQDEEEKIILLVRKHWITNLGWMGLVAVMILAPLLLGRLPFLELMPLRFQFMSLILWYLLTTAVALEGFLSWFFDAFVITDERIIDIDFKNLIYKNITATKIDNIEDVTYTVSGALPSMLNYGTVLVQTAGAGIRISPEDATASIEIRDTPKPAKVARLINELILEEEQEKLEGRVR